MSSTSLDLVQRLCIKPLDVAVRVNVITFHKWSHAKFQKKHPLPPRAGHFGESYKTVKSGSWQKQSVELLRDVSGTAFGVEVKACGSNQRFGYAHANQEQLLEFFDLAHGPIKWLP